MGLEYAIGLVIAMFLVGYLIYFLLNISSSKGKK